MSLTLQQGLVSLTMKGLKYMRKDEGGAGGTIINVASTAAITKLRYLPIYAGSKMAVLHFSQSLAVSMKEILLTNVVTVLSFLIFPL